MIAYKANISDPQSQFIIVLIENQPKSPLLDRLSVYTVSTSGLTLVSQSQTPKVYSLCISASVHHSGYHHNDLDTDDVNDNTYYTSVSQSPLGEIN